MSSEESVLFINGHCVVIVQSLSLQHLGQLSLLSSRLLQLGSLVLEPDLELVLTEPQLSTEILPSLLGQVSVGSELLPQPLQLLRGEGSPGSFVVRAGGSRGDRGGLGFLHLPRSGPGGRPVRVSGAEDPGWPQLTVGTSHHPGRTVLVCLGSLVGGLGEIHRNLDVHLGLFRGGGGGFGLFGLLAPQGRSGQLSLGWRDGSWPGDGPG